MIRALLDTSCELVRVSSLLRALLSALALGTVWRALRPTRALVRARGPAGLPFCPISEAF